MALIDDIIKWFKAPKTLKGIAGMIVIVIVLALDFAYWAGAIDVTSIASGSGDDNEEEEVVIPDDYQTSFAGNLPRGSYVAPQIPDPRGEGEGTTYNLYPIPIESNITEVIISSSGDGGRPRIDGGDSNDIDLYLYEPGKDAGGDLDSTSPNYDAATQYLAEIMTLSRVRDYGNWTLRVDCYTGSDVAYTIDVSVTYARSNETAEDDGGE
jgi:hypothetical protein